MAGLLVVRLAQGLLGECKDLLPAVHGLLLTVSRAVVIEEAVAGAVVAMELVLLPMLFELRLVRVDLFRCRRLVLVAEDPDDRAREVLGVLDRRDRLVRGELFLRLNHASAPALDHGVQALQPAAGKKRLPASRARAEDADLAAHIRQRAKPRVRAVEIAQHPSVRGAP